MRSYRIEFVVGRPLVTDPDVQEKVTLNTIVLATDQSDAWEKVKAKYPGAQRQSIEMLMDSDEATTTPE